ncbi:hypothetical protein O9X98_06725 [Agrobacterium salinitolerans]|nr:hypothetical protein [Agrobacterium salinitolerans]
MNGYEYQALSLAKVMLDCKPKSDETASGEVFYQETSIDDVLRFIETNVVPKWGDVAVDMTRVRAMIEVQHNVAFDEKCIMAHEAAEPWITDTAKEGWDHWHRYRAYMAQSRPPAVLADLDDLTDQIINISGNPKDGGRWHRKGLVYGDIQSGKTATMIGLMNKAADAGHKFIVVLSGMEEDLRVQTQSRVDEGMIGQSRRKTDKAGQYTVTQVGVGQFGGVFANSLTSLDHDLSQKSHITLSMASTTATTVLVVKKNSTILGNLLRLLAAQYAINPEESSRTIPESIFIVDDECDCGSVDTGKRDWEKSPEEHEATRINQRIRLILKLFDRSVYVGFTGTPFANLLSDADLRNGRYGDDLFPKDFVANLVSPPNYLGVGRLVGNKSRHIDPDEAANSQGLPELLAPIPARDAEWLPTGHKSGHVVTGPLPTSLQEAIDRFVITAALRCGKHNTMLVNLTRYQDVQHRLRDVIDDYVAGLRNAVALDDAATMNALRNLYELDMVPAAHDLWKRETGEARIALPLPVWGEVVEQVVRVLDALAVKAINGSSSDTLQYLDTDAACVIAVGGQKLSRGLTLEGLTISYFVRTTDQFDSALQMGRWFGYRDSYLALCRLYATDETFASLSLMAETSAGLRTDIAIHGIHTKPRDMCLSFGNHPGKRVTARNKQQNTVLVQTTLSGKMPETKIFDPSTEMRGRNMEAVGTLLSALGPYETPIKQKGSSDILRDHENARLWRGVECGEVFDFLDAYSTHADADLVQSDRLRSFIAGQAQAGNSSFSRWNVALMSGRPGRAGHDRAVGGVEYTARLRTPDSSFVSKERQKLHYLDPKGRYVIKRIATEIDELVDATQHMIDHANRLQAMASNSKDTKRKIGTPGWEFMRAARQHLGLPGLLLLYPIVPALDEHLYGWDPIDTPYFGFAMILPGERVKQGRLMTRQSQKKLNGGSNE